MKMTSLSLSSSSSSPSSLMLLSLFILSSFVLIKVKCSEAPNTYTNNIKVFSVATEETDGYQRYVRSAAYYNIEVITLGLNTDWKGGNMKYSGGGHKVNLLKEAIEPLKNEKNQIIIFTDSYDVVFTSGLDDIITKFQHIEANVLFGAEHFCWPNKELKDTYPPVPAQASRFLNSGMFMGYTSDLYELLKEPIKDTDDDQLYYTLLFLNETLRSKHNIKLDYKSEIFQNLNGASNDIKMDVDLKTGSGQLQNVIFMTYPNIIHGNGPDKILLNSFANYLAGSFKNGQCVICEENLVSFTEKTLPIVSVSVFIEYAVPFFEEFLDNILSLDYPKERINLFIHNNIPYHEELIKKFVKEFGKEYKTNKLILSTDQINEIQARKLSVQQAIKKGSDYLFSIDANVRIDDTSILQDLLRYNRSFIAPVLIRPNEIWSNFWGALSENGYYARSHDYLEIVKGNIKGIWNVPYVTDCYLIRKSAFKKINFEHKAFDSDMALCASLRNEGIFMNVINIKNYGHLVNVEYFNTELARPDFYMLLSNQLDWERKYIHPEYYDQFKQNYTHKQPCPDVYWFPIVTDKFCNDLIAIMENYGKWSDGSNMDKRLDGGYEAVPTRDIHMNQVGLDPMWLRFLKIFIRPLVEEVFTGYYHNPPRSLMNFVVRYRPDEQPSLRPHHDSSTYTINIALNRVGIDYEGGGCKFIRYNCSVKATKMGWMLMHPGRLTHLHEGLTVTNGTRYIMISFIDP